MSVLIDVVLPVFAIAGLAALAQSRLHLGVRDLSRAVFYLFAPALVFDAMSTTHIGATEFGQVAAVMVLGMALTWILAILVARPLRLAGPTRAAFENAIVLMNAGNFGLPVVLFAFGQQALAPASICFTLNAVASASLGVYLSASGRASVWTAIKRAAGVPLAYAAVVGLLLNLAGWTVPGPVAKAVHLLGQASVPGMLTVLGLQLARTVHDGPRHLRLPALGAVAVIRLLVAPALAFGLAWAIGLQGLARNVTVLEMGMPTAVMTTILATEFESDPPFASLAVLVTTLVSIATVTVLLNILA